MQSNQHAEIVIDLTPNAPLADVIELPLPEAVSFYVRNSGMLPRLGDRARNQYSRSSLPTPVEPAPDTLVNRIRDFISVNRPAWLPQR